MKVYDEDSLCPKCGYGVVDSNYKAHFIIYGYDSDYIERHCKRCGYYWDETPLDRKEQANG